MPVTFTIRDKFLRSDILVCVGQPSDVSTVLRSRYGKQIHIEKDDLPDSECSACFSTFRLYGGASVYVIWLEAGCSGGDLVHEIHHATVEILKAHCIDPTNEEVAAYYEGWLYEAVFDRLKTITKRKVGR